MEQLWTVRNIKVRKQLKHAKDKTRLDFWSSRIFKPTFTRDGKQHVSAHYAVEIQFQGKRHKWSLGSGNKDAAAYRARELYLFLKAHGWDKTLAKYRPQPGAETSDITVGQFIERVEAVSEISGTTLHGYVSALRKIISDSFDLDSVKKEVRCPQRGKRGMDPKSARHKTCPAHAANSPSLEAFLSREGRA